MSAVVRLDREKFEQIILDMETLGEVDPQRLRDAVLPEPQVRWGVGHGRRRHVIAIEFQIDPGRHHVTARTLCGNFVTARARGADLINTERVLALQPCAGCVHAATSRGLTL